MGVVDAPLEPLQVVALDKELRDIAVSLGRREKFIVGKERRVAGPQISEDYAGPLVAGIRRMADQVFVFPSTGLAPLVQTTAVDVIEPTVIDAPEPAIFPPPVTQITPPLLPLA